MHPVLIQIIVATAIACAILLATAGLLGWGLLAFARVLGSYLTKDEENATESFAVLAVQNMQRRLSNLPELTDEILQRVCNTENKIEGLAERFDQAMIEVLIEELRLELEPRGILLEPCRHSGESDGWNMRRDESRVHVLLNPNTSEAYAVEDIGFQMFTLSGDSPRGPVYSLAELPELAERVDGFFKCLEAGAAKSVHSEDAAAETAQSTGDIDNGAAFDETLIGPREQRNEASALFDETQVDTAGMAPSAESAEEPSVVAAV
jgi:hypothetical protein